MSASLQWAIINKFNSKDLRKSGITWTKEAGHLKGKKSFKYCTLVNPGNVAVSANADGGVVLSTTGNKVIFYKIFFNFFVNLFDDFFSSN